ncbi:MAG: hypothetical protein P8O10_02425 [Pseudorhodobacter sp.]|nr:hypothetical protein [Pseudorhodobacter sp.]
MERPKLTLPKEAETLLRAEYARASVILEFGSGGSTVLAGEMVGKQVFTVESDHAWLKKMQRWFDANPPMSSVTLHHGNIGPTTDWGRPVDQAHWRKFLNYPLTIWDRPDFQHPDVVLVDGRFRVGCFLATLMRITRPVVVLFDDYVGRKAYHIVEEFFAPTGFAGRMARFNVAPRMPGPQEFGRWAGLMQRPL